MTDRRGAKPKVIRVIARLNVGGPARHVVLLNEGLERRGYDTLLVHGSVDESEASLEPLAADAGLATVRIAELGRRIRLLDDALAFWKLLRLVFDAKPDIVHTHTAKAGALGRVAAFTFNMTRRRRDRCVIAHTFHGHVLTGYFSAPVNAAVRLVERSLALVTDSVVTISPAQRRDIVEVFRIASPARTAMIPLGLSLAPLLGLAADAPSSRCDLGIGDQDFVVAYVGRFVPIKDLATLVRAFASLVREVPDSWLLLAGDGPARGSLETLASELGVAPRVKFLGWIDDLPRAYAAMDVCALSSLNEGTPVAIIEAMAAARAVVAPAVGGVPDIVRDNDTGLLVPSGDPAALAAALRRLASDAGLRGRLGAAARQEAARRFGSDRLVEDVARLYDDLLSRRRGHSESRKADR